MLALSLRTTSPALLGEILDAWLQTAVSEEESDCANIKHLDDVHP